MASIGTLLKSEITRLSRREIRSQVEPVKKASAAYRRHIAALKRQVHALERQVAVLNRVSRKTVEPAAAGTEASSNRFVAKGLRTLRSRLGLSAADFGKLVGVSGQSIYNWESKKAVPRKAQVATLASLRALGKREAQTRLEQLVAKTPKKRAKRARKG